MIKITKQINSPHLILFIATESTRVLGLVDDKWFTELTWTGTNRPVQFSSVCRSEMALTLRSPSFKLCWTSFFRSWFCSLPVQRICWEIAIRLFGLPKYWRYQALQVSSWLAAKYKQLSLRRSSFHLGSGCRHLIFDAEHGIDSTRRIQAQNLIQAY